MYLFLDVSKPFHCNSGQPDDLLNVCVSLVDGLPEVIEPDLEPELGLEDLRDAVVAGSRQKAGPHQLVESLNFWSLSVS